MDFLLLLIELFFARSYGWGALRAIICSKSAISLQRRSVDPKFQVDHSFSQKNRLNDLSYGIKIWRDCFSVSSQITIHAFDRQTEFSSLDRVCIPCSAVKILGPKLQGKVVSAPQAESAPPSPRQSIPIFRKLGDLDGGRWYLGSFSLCFEGHDQKRSTFGGTKSAPQTKSLLSLCNQRLYLLQQLRKQRLMTIV